MVGDVNEEARCGGENPEMGAIKLVILTSTNNRAFQAASIFIIFSPRSRTAVPSAVQALAEEILDTLVVWITKERDR